MFASVSNSTSLSNWFLLQGVDNFAEAGSSANASVPFDRRMTNVLLEGQRGLHHAPHAPRYPF